MTVKNILGHFKSLLIRGALFMAPIWLCIFLGDLIYRLCENSLGSVTSQIVRWILPSEWLAGVFANGHVPGLSLLTAAILFGIIGLVASWSPGQAGLRLIDYLFLAIPGLNMVYAAARKVLDALAEPGKSRFRKVVFVSWPSPEVRTVGFVTNEVLTPENEKAYWIFVPHMPNPTSGFVLIVKACNVVETDMTPEEGLKLCLSLGVLAPPLAPLTDQRHR